MVRATWITEHMFGSQSRRLGAHDREELSALLAREPGYSLFLGTNLELFGLKNEQVRFWGVFARGQLTGALMMVERRAALYAPPDGDIIALARLADSQRPEFAMGRADLVEALLHEHPPLAVEQREEHYFAELTQGDFQGTFPLASDVTVRRAGPADIPALTRLYTGADGFEQTSDEQIARTMRGRVSTLRTYLAQIGAEAVAGASTSAETRAAAMVGGVWTAPEWRNRGLSTAVVAALSGELLHEGRRPYLFYRLDNAPAARVYARVGYHPVGRWTVVYFDRRDSA